MHVSAAIVAVVPGFMFNLCYLEWIPILTAIATVFIARYLILPLTVCVVSSNRNISGKKKK